MRILSKCTQVALFTFLAIATFSCSDDDTTTVTGNTLYEVAQQQPNISTFVQAINRAGVQQSYESTTKFTVLAPNNAAMSEYLAEKNYSSIDAVPIDELKQLLFNHLINANFKKETFNAGYITTFSFVPMASNRNISLLVDNSNGVKFNGVSEILTANLTASNGTLHIVNKVIAIPTIYDHIKVNPDMTILKTALDRNTASPLRLVLSSTEQAPYTFFAPSNAAFNALLDELDIDQLSQISDADLEQYLAYHLIPTDNIAHSSFVNNQTLNSFLGQPLTVTLTGGGRKLTDIHGRVSTIIYADLQGSNGIIHVLDKVLKP